MDILRALMEGKTVKLSWEDYIALYKDRQTRRDTLQMALNKAGAEYMAASLKAEEQTLHFKATDG